VRLGPATKTKADYEGLYLVETLEGGVPLSQWCDEASLPKVEKNCGECCHPPASFVIMGQVKDGKLNGRPVEEIVRVKESGW
jgi:hypothetical protein